MTLRGTPSAHTPGPWYVTGPNIHARWTDDDGNVTDRWVATVSAGQGDEPRMTDYANASLIASAPALLEALEWVINSCFDEYSFHAVMSDPAHFVNAAIRAAKGESA